VAKYRGVTFNGDDKYTQMGYETLRFFINVWVYLGNYTKHVPSYRTLIGNFMIYQIIYITVVDLVSE